MKLLSDVRMGIEMDIIKNIDMNVINLLFLNTQPASIQKSSDNELTTLERDVKRAEIIRGKLNL